MKGCAERTSNMKKKLHWETPMRNFGIKRNPQKKKEILKKNLTKEQKMVWGIQLVLGNTRFKSNRKNIFRFLRKQF